VEAFRLDA
jgi:hypothetical protein